MKLAHFEELKPVCPSCREGAIGISRVVAGTPRELEEGLLECGGCHHLFPVVDGIPLLTKDLRRVVSEQILSIVARTDLSETTLALLGECCGSGSPFDSARQHISTYLHGHFEEGGIAKILAAGLAAAGKVEGPILDVGCSVGRTTLELASRALVVGVDLNFGMLRAAKRILREGRLAYARRETGLVYDERTIEASRAHAERADFWCADALALPFRAGTFGLVSSLNLVDLVASPLQHLQGARDALRAGGALLVASPFDWQPSVVPVEQWLGGHSPLGPARGRPEAAFRALVGGEHLPGLKIEAEEDGFEWPVRLNARAEVRYRVALWVLRRLPLAA